MKAGKGRSFIAQAYLFSVTLHLVIVLVFSAWNYRVHSKSRFDNFSELTLQYEIATTRTVQLRKEVTLPPKQADDKETIKVREKPTPKPQKNHVSSDIGVKNQVNVEANDFPFSYYLRLMRNRIQENWNPLYQADGKERTNALVSFKVQRNGSVTDIMVKTSSGKYMFDAAAQRAIVAAGKLPPLPDEYALDQLNVTINFEATWQN